MFRAHFRLKKYQYASNSRFYYWCWVGMAMLKSVSTWKVVKLITSVSIQNFANFNMCLKFISYWKVFELKFSTWFRLDILPLCNLPQSNHKFFISTLIWKSYELLDSWLLEIQNDMWLVLKWPWKVLQNLVRN